MRLWDPDHGTERDTHGFITGLLDFTPAIEAVVTQYYFDGELDTIINTDYSAPGYLYHPQLPQP